MQANSTGIKDSSLFEAIHFAAKAHGDQVRKGGGIPYITHPLAVGMILQRYGFPDAWIAAGILHDTLEDTPVTFRQLEARFGSEIAEIVRGCSEPAHGSDPWQSRKQHTITFLQTAPYAVRIVSAADKLHNLISLEHDLRRVGDALWRRFSAGRERQAWYYHNVARSVTAGLEEEQMHALFTELQQTAIRVFPPGAS